MCPMVASIKSNGEIGMISIPCGFDIANSQVGDASWSWTLPSNDSNPCGSPENPANVVDLLFFCLSPNEFHWQ